MQRLIRTLKWTGATAALAASLAGCTSDISLEDFNVKRRATNFVNSQSLAFSSHGRDFSVRPVTQADLVGPGGECAAAAPVAATPAPGVAGDPSDPAATALIESGVALQMTECEVVARAGAPDNVEFGNTQGSQRSVVLTYTRGPRPGIYRFSGGRLVSIERVPEPPAPAKPPAEKKRRPAA